MEATVWFENGKLSKKRSNLQAKCTSQPVLRFRSLFTEDSWSTDLFVLFQNSIRHDIQDLYVMLRSAAYRIDAVKVSDSRALQKWLVEFSQMVSMYFTVQENIIYPNVLRRQKETKLSVTDLQKRTRPLVDDLLAVHKESLAFVAANFRRDDIKLLNFDSEEVSLSLQGLSKLVFGLVSRLEQLFSWELQNVAAIVQSCMSAEESKFLTILSLRELLRYDAGEIVYGGFSQWLSPSYKDQYLSGIDKITMARLRRKERRWVKTHRSLQMRFAKR